MPTKDQYSNQINEILDMELDWSKMKKDELELFHELLDSGALIEDQAKHVVKNHGKKKMEEEIDDWRPGKLMAKVL